MDLIYQNTQLAFSSWDGMPPIQESRYFFRLDIKFTVDKMPWTPKIHRHYYVSCELENQNLNLGGLVPIIEGGLFIRWKIRTVCLPPLFVV